MAYEEILKLVKEYGAAMRDKDFEAACFFYAMIADKLAYSHTEELKYD